MKNVVYGYCGVFLHSTRYYTNEESLAIEFSRKTRAFGISQGQASRVLAAYEARGYTTEYIYSNVETEFDVSLEHSNGRDTVNIEYNAENKKLSITQYHLIRKGITYA